VNNNVLKSVENGCETQFMMSITKTSMKYTPTRKALNSFKSMFKRYKWKMEDLERKVKYVYHITLGIFGTHMEENSFE
jgi:hypothetical protein